jgi:multidrug efflux pump subunit AcrA (membrane-fusion protein)
MIKRLSLLLPAILTVALVACKPMGPGDGTPVTTQGLKVSVLEVVKGTIENRLALASLIEPWEQVTVFSKIPGKIVEKSVREGQRVAKDDVVALVNRDEIGAEANNYQVTSPIAGVVARMTLDAGSMVGPTVPVATIVNMNVVKTTVNVIESEIGEVHIGLPATVRVPAYPARKIPGTVSNVLPIVDPMSHTAKVEVRINNPDLAVKPGMSATVELALGRHDNAVVIPKDAIIEKMGEKYVFLFVDGVARKANIETGFDDGTNVEITKGVNIGDRLVTSDMNVLVDGTKIQVREAK